MKARPEFIGHYLQFIDEDNASYPGSDELLSIGSAVGKELGLQKIGIHIEILLPGRRTSWPHAESVDEEFAYVIEGHPEVWLNGETYSLRPGDFIAFPAESGIAHTFLNNTDVAVRMLVGGEKTKSFNKIYYPLNDERNLVMKTKEILWENHPPQVMGDHDGLPDKQRKGEKTQAFTLPTIDTERLVLRGLALNDAHDFLLFAKNPALYEHTRRTAPRDISDSERVIREINQSNLLGNREFAIVLKGLQKKVIGTIGYRWFSLNDRVIEIFFILSEDHQGQGYIGEAAKALIDFCWENENVERIQARCISENTKSKNVLKKLGMIHEGTLRKSFKLHGESYDMELYSIIRSER